MPDPWNVFRTSLIRASRGFDAAARVCSSLAATSLRRVDIGADTDQKWSGFYTRDADIDKGLFPWEHRLVEGFVRSGDRILVIGCGTARDVIPLPANGHDVTGVDPSEHAVVLARAACARRGVPAEIIQGYFEDLPLSPSFDVVIFSKLTYALIPESGIRIAALRKARGLLTHGGRMILSYVGNPQRPRSRLMQLVKLGARLRRSDWHPEQGDILHPMPNGRPRFHYEHIFVPGELEAEASAAGLRVIFHDDSSFDYWIAALAA